MRESSYFCIMAANVQDILASLLLPKDSDWQIESFVEDEAKESIYVNVRFSKPEVTVAGKKFPIYDFRPERTWRHLDLWQCKTFITARISRYLVDGKVVSLEVPCHNAKEACLHIGLMVMCRTSPSNENLTSIILTIFKRVKYEEPCDGRLSSTIP